MRIEFRIGNLKFRMSVIIPLQSIVKNPYIGQLFDNLDFSKKFDVDLVNHIKNHSLMNYFFTANILNQKSLLDNKTVLLDKEIGNIEDLLNGMKLVLYLKDESLILKDDIIAIKKYFDIGKYIY